MGEHWENKNIFKKRRIKNGFLFCLIVILSLFSIVYYDVLTLSPYQEISPEESPAFLNTRELNLEKKWRLPVKAQISGLKDEAIAAATAQGPDNYRVDLSVEGKIPLKKVDVQVVSPKYLVAGGHSIGVLLQTNGITVVGHSPVILENGDGIYPARDAGIAIGDFIITINGQNVSTNKQVAQIISTAGENNKELIIEFIRDGVKGEVKIRPLYCYDSKSFRAGLYVRDNTAGIGTLTYYDPETKNYGALGHKIADLEGAAPEGEPLGSILRADIQGIKLGRKGVPGEKIGVFVGNSWRGEIYKNTNLGIFGKLEYPISNPFYPRLLPVALINQVKTGPAQICTVIKGEECQLYKINILKILPNYRSSGKGMIIEITDENLLSQTGGIVQGMSGSPIIQNNRLVGAITHVFINEPTKGYACFIQWMLDEGSRK